MGLADDLRSSFCATKGKFELLDIQIERILDKIYEKCKELTKKGEKKFVGILQDASDVGNFFYHSESSEYWFYSNMDDDGKTHELNLGVSGDSANPKFNMYERTYDVESIEYLRKGIYHGLKKEGFENIMVEFEKHYHTYKTIFGSIKQSEYVKSYFLRVSFNW